MIIKSISLTNFRNHANYKLECTDQTSLILGTNGWGKTSILEAIYILTRGKSFRATDSEILRRGSEAYFIKLEYENGEIVTAGYDGQNKFFTTMNKKTKRLSSHSKYPVVLFVPSDLNLISHAPSRRRDYFDNIFGILDEKYSSDLSKYKKALRQRSEILKQPNLTKDSLFSWNILLAQYGSRIAQARANYTEKINQLLTPTYYSIAKNSDVVEIIYKSEALHFSENQYLRTLEQNYQKDVYLGHTTFGIHHDDYLFNFNHCPADGSASRGETRSIILSLKFIEAELFNQFLGKQPLILLDDVFSELDPSRRECLVNNFKNHQVIITSVEDVNSI